MPDLRITTTVEATAAGEGAVCPGHGSEVDGWTRKCGLAAVWQITTTTEHAQPTPGQAHWTERREARLATHPDERYPIPKQTRRRYVTVGLYCESCVPKRHKRGGLQLWRRKS